VGPPRCADYSTASTRGRQVLNRYSADRRSKQDECGRPNDTSLMDESEQRRRVISFTSCMSFTLSPPP
jgi:hypothetical protein